MRTLIVTAVANSLFLSRGFRPFFLAAGLWSFFAMAFWIASINLDFSLPGQILPTYWHAHEMIFGYVAAVIVGFLLTAIPNWTGRLPVKGPPLAGLALVWLAGRLALLLSSFLPLWLVALVDVAFLWLVVLLILREILAGKNKRNLPVVAIVSALALANTLFHLDRLSMIDAGSLSLRLGTSAVLVLITLIGGRVVPSFTRNWLAKRGEKNLPTQANRFDLAAIFVTILSLVSWTVLEEGAMTGALLVVAGILNFVRLVRWGAQKTLAEAMVWIMHLAYAWLALGMLLLGLAQFLDVLTFNSGLHALTTGAIGTMTLGIMTRATLGHCGRELTADRATITIYLVITLAALCRVILPEFSDWAAFAYGASGFLWLAGFAIFVWHYGPMQLGRR